MTKFLLLIMVVNSLIFPVSALEITVPEVPRTAEEFMPQNTDSISAGLSELIRNAFKLIHPEIEDAVTVSLSLVCAVLIMAVEETFSDKTHSVIKITGSAVIATLLLQNINSMIHLAAETVCELCDYGKLFFPVMTTSLAAQGGVTSSASLYAATAFFSALLSSLISSLLIPLVYLFLALATANSAVGEDILKRAAEFLKNSISWLLKTLLTCFISYMSITGVINGTTDAAALKATKITISSVVPVIGGILSDSSEAILVSAGMIKNAAGIYGILAALAIILDPFVKIGTHYLILKITAAVCSIFGNKDHIGIIDDFSSAMGLLLGMTGTVCVLILISTVCFMKGVG